MTQTILTSYTPVYLYSYTLLLFLPVFHFLLVRLVPLQKKTVKFSHLSRLVRVLPGIVWPDFWSTRGAVGLGEEDHAQREQQSQKEHEEDISRVYSSRQLLKPDDIAASLMHHVTVLLTFGSTNPLLAMAVTCTICLETLQWVMLLNRFVFRRLLLRGMWGTAVVIPQEGGEAAMSSETAIATSVSQRRDKVVSDVIATIEKKRLGGGSDVIDNILQRSSQHYEKLDQCLCLVETSVQNFGALLSTCVLPVVFISCIFFVFFSWDIAADRLGFVQSIWVPLIAMSIPFVLVLYIKLNRSSQ